MLSKAVDDDGDDDDANDDHLLDPATAPPRLSEESRAAKAGTPWQGARDLAAYAMVPP